jgi:hypothetical protein
MPDATDDLERMLAGVCARIEKLFGQTEDAETEALLYADPELGKWWAEWKRKHPDDEEEKAETVTVECSDRGGIKLTLDGKSIRLDQGKNTIDAEFWHRWLSENSLRNAVKSGLVREVK